MVCSRSYAALLLTLAVTTGTAPLAWTYRTGNYVWAVAVSSDGRHAIAGSDDMRTYFFDTKSSENQLLWSLATSGYVRQVAISKNGEYAAAGDSEGNVFLFHPTELSATPAWHFKTGSSIVAISMVEDGKYLAVGNRQGDLLVFGTGLAEPLIKRFSIYGGVLAIALSGSGALAATGTRGGLYFFAETASASNFTWSFEGHMNFPLLTIAEHGEYIVLGGSDGHLYLIDRLGRLIDKQGLGGAITALSTAKTAGYIVAGSTNGNVLLYRLDQRLQKLNSLQAHEPITSTAMSDDGGRISIACLNGTIWMFDEAMRRLVWTYETRTIVHSLSMSSDGRVMAAASDAGSVYLFDEGTSDVSHGEPLIVSQATLFAMILGSIAIGYLVLRRRMNRRPEEER